MMQPAALFPPFVLLLHFPVLGPLLLKISMQMLTGAITYALLRRVGLGRFAAGLGGAVFDLNGCSVRPRTDPAVAVPPHAAARC